MKKIFLLVAAICVAAVLKAQDSLKVFQLEGIVITGNKTETPIEKSGKTIFKLNREEIEANRGKDVTDLLNEIPGVQINGNFATPGTDVSYRIRGAQSEQTLILIDGIPYNDPSGLAQTFDLRMLDLDQVESIEVLKGGMSSLYGTGAAAGVINITLKKAANDIVSGNVNVEYGSFNTFTSNANVSGTSDKLSYMISGSLKTSDGFSAAKDTLGNEGYDDDGIRSLNFMGKLGYQFTDQFSVQLMTAFDDVESDYDAGAFQDADSEVDLEFFKSALMTSYQWAGGSVKGNFSWHTNNRIFNAPDYYDPNSRSISEYNGNTFQADVFLDQNLTDQIKLIGGVNVQRPVWEPEDADSESFTMIDPYVSIIQEYGNLNLQVGGRLNNHSLYGSNFVWNVNPSLLFDLNTSKVKVLGSYATAFLTPSLNQLYAGDFGFLAANAGNPDLSPQESQSAEFGFEWFSDNQFKLAAVGFYRKDKNFIDFVFNDDFTIGKYVNVDNEIEVAGIELNAEYSFLPELKLAGHYTYTELLTDDVILRRVPDQKYGFTLSAIPVDDVLVKVTHLHVGEISENADVTLDPYDLFDVFVSYSFNKITFSGSVNNVFDAEYTSRYGWTAAKRNYNVGLRFSF